MASASAYSWFGPPRPRPRSVTVSSPPDKITARRPFTLRSRASRACVAATSRASPSIAVPSRTQSYPAARTACSTARKTSAGRAARSKEVCAKTGSPGFGVSFAGSASACATSGGTLRSWRATMARASASVVGSGTVGPEPITAGSSPGTSEMATATSGAGNACCASRPPLMRERCLRTVLTSTIEAPEARSARVTACLSASERPAAGAIQFAEAPPETRTSTRSCGPADSAKASASIVAARPAASGSGWPASTTRTIRVG